MAEYVYVVLSVPMLVWHTSSAYIYEESDHTGTVPYVAQGNNWPHSIQIGRVCVCVCVCVCV